MEDSTKIRLQKYLSSLGICSRRECEQLLLNKKIIVNDKIANLGIKVNERDEIIVNGKKIINYNVSQKYDYILLNKPKGYICTLKDPQGRKTIYDYIGLNKYLYSIGRLDYNSTGIIILTNDGAFANLMAHPSSNVEREYIAKLEKDLSTEDLNYLNSKNFILNGKKSIQKVNKLRDKIYSININEGRNHHIKNLFLAINNFVISLHRKKYGIFNDGDLKIGEWKILGDNEIKTQKKLLKNNE